MKNKRFLILGLFLVFGFVSSCATYRPVDVTNAQAIQINQMKFHEVQPGEKVKTLYIKRKGSFINDLSQVKNGRWYSAHKDLLVSVDAVLKNGKKPMWRIDYVD